MLSYSIWAPPAFCAVSYSVTIRAIIPSFKANRVIDPHKLCVTFESDICSGCVVIMLISRTSLQWRHNERDGVSNHQPHHCLLNRLFRAQIQETSKLRFTGLCAGNSPVTGEFPAQMACEAGNVSISWRHHVLTVIYMTLTLSSVNNFVTICSVVPFHNGSSPWTKQNKCKVDDHICNGFVVIFRIFMKT